jgi:thiol-disulfide isomerase/thioredoxin
MNKTWLFLPIFFGCITTNSLAQIYNEICNFPFDKGKAIITAYNGENLDTVFNAENLKFGDTVHCNYDPKGELYIVFVFTFNSKIGELITLVSSLENNSINHYRFSTKGSILLTNSSSEYNRRFFAGMMSIDSVLAVDFNEAIHWIEGYKNQEVYFYCMNLLMPLFHESHFKNIDTAFKYALQGKSTYWKKTLVESYFKFNKLSSEIFHYDEMVILNSQDTEFDLNSLLDSTKENVIYIWASWCMPCVKKLKSLYYEMDSINRSTNLILVSIDKDKEVWVKAIKKIKYPYQHYFAKNSDAFTKNLFITTIPQSFKVSYLDKKINRVEF